jgi:hypothetical protein
MSLDSVISVKFLTVKSKLIFHYSLENNFLAKKKIVCISVITVVKENDSIMATYQSIMDANIHFQLRNISETFIVIMKRN